MGRRFPQNTSREKITVPKWLLEIDQDDIMTTPFEFPVLKAIIEKEGITTIALNGKATALDPILIHQDHYVL
tara:strand:+ start:841 stop:1056 length:216 start_codon:yes stop_codon:yes gene_type:complete